MILQLYSHSFIFQEDKSGHISGKPLSGRFPSYDLLTEN